MTQPPGPYGPPPQYGYAPYGYPPPRPKVAGPALGWALLAVGVVGVIGSFGPWASVTVLGHTLTIDGTDTGKDGTLTLVFMVVVLAMGLVVGLRQGRVWTGIVALVFALLAALVAVIDTADVSTGVDGALRDAISVGWGLWVTLVASVLAVGLSIAAIARRT